MFWRKRKASEFQAEIEAHLQLEAERLHEQGLSEAEARHAAHRAFGNVTKAQERFYESSHWMWLDNLWRDLRYSARMLRKSPSFTFAAIATLAVAIGANAVVFSVLNAFTLRPLNVPQAQSLYGLEVVNGSGYQSYPDYLDFRNRNHSFESLAAYNIAQAGVDTGDNTASAWIYEASGNYFDALGIQPYLGRVFHASDERGPNSAPYAVLGYSYWHTHFQNDRHVVGRVIYLNKHPFTIVGVAPRGFRGTLIFATPDLFVPIVNQEQVQAEGKGGNVLNARGTHWIFEVIGHLRTGVTPAQAAADLNSIAASLEKTYPKEESKVRFQVVRPSLYGKFLGSAVRAFLGALMLLAGLILLAACANLDSLFASRAADRSRELALRLALGSSRWRVLRQLFTEAILISLVGGAFGLWGGILLLQRLSVWNPFPRYPISMPVNPDARVYVVALLMALVSGLLVGVVPVRQVLHTDPYGVIKSGSLAKGGRRITIRDALLGAQIAICAVLVTSSFVAVRGLVRSLHSDFGFDPQNAMLVDTDLNMAGYTGKTAPEMQKRVIEAVKMIPGVASVALVDWPPLADGSEKETNVFADQTTDFRPANALGSVVTYKISPEYFRAAGTALLSGRSFTWSDDQKTPRVAIINPQFARKIFGSQSGTVGRYFKADDGTRVEVIGVAEQGKYTSLTEDPQAAMFLPILQWPSGATRLVVRSRRDPQQLTAAIRDQLRGLDSGLPAFIETWGEGLGLALFGERMAAMALGVLGFLGALLSITGIFGMAAYAVSKRKRELGIRMALGAQRKEVLRAALGRAVKLLAFGSAAGLILGILASRVLAAVVYQATPRDPFVLTGVVLAMMLVGLLATWIPAQRTLSIDPAILLREE